MTDTTLRDPDAIERDIKRTQREMSETVDRIGEQMTPRQLLNSLLDKADESGFDARTLLYHGRRNPLALGLIAAGGIWLMSEHDAKPSALKPDSGFGASDDPDYDQRFDSDPDHGGYVSHMSRFQRQADEDDSTYLRRRDEHRGAYFMIERDHDEDHKSYRKRLDEASEKLRERRDRFAESARDARSQATRQGRRVARKGREAYYDNPLIGGLAAAIVGAVAGSAIPATRMEREKLGSAGASAIDAAKAKAEDAAEQARAKKDEVVEKAGNKIEQAGPA